jgi:phosphoenolpyruvate synthase/pyruvate phosphate dikinase
MTDSLEILEYVLDFAQITLKDLPRVGGKNASLGELFRALEPKGVGVLSTALRRQPSRIEDCWVPAVLKRRCGQSLTGSIRRISMSCRIVGKRPAPRCWTRRCRTSYAPPS